MPNALYVKGKERILSGSVNFVSDALRVALVSTAYAQNITTDEFYGTILPSVIGTAVLMTGKSVAGGAFDAADTTFSAVAAGSNSEGVVIFKDTGDVATSPLIAYIDTITGFPLMTNGGDITIQWDNGNFRIFSL